MIIFHRTAAIAPGKGQEAWKFANDISETFKSITGVELTLMMPLSGNPHRITWRAQYDDLAALDAAQAKSMQDEGYLNAVSDAAHLFIAGSAIDQMWRTM
ncbi:hypothetical protein LCL97_24010 [Seohaeicola saemankumensis]|nr:hypothetical protein [Seohaeicola saemankumensis]MCA0873904.1 hypothetical protein [Seohaeicola saemankumensis]